MRNDCGTSQSLDIQLGSTLETLTKCSSRSGLTVALKGERSASVQSTHLARSNSSRVEPRGRRVRMSPH